jgi:hypothetical protein
MNVQQLILDSFYYEWMRLRAKPGEQRKRPSFVMALEKRAEVESELGPAVQRRDSIFDLEAVQKKVDSDLQNFKGVDRRRRSRYHQMNLRFLSRLYAHKLFSVTQGRTPTEESMKEALRCTKEEMGCPLYPFQR